MRWGITSDLLIRGLEMPHDPKGVTICIFPDGVAKCMDMVSFEITTKEAVPVPPHGRLTDGDALYDVVKKRTRNWAGGWSDIECVLTGNDIKDAPTIIPASE